MIVVAMIVVVVVPATLLVVGRWNDRRFEKRYPHAAELLREMERRKKEEG